MRTDGSTVKTEFDFLPVTKEDMEKRGWQQPDFVYLIGDAYVDHPSFGPAVISRILEAHGYKVAMVAQPDWNQESSIQIFGPPRLAFLVSAGNMDSLVNHFTAAKKRRSMDAYSPGGKSGKRPDRATIVYCNLIRRVYGTKIPIVIGGLEASLRRFGHYDYWSDTVRRSILIDSGADLISYGMGEHSIVEIADALKAGISAADITFIKGTVYRTKDRSSIYEALELPEFEKIKESKAEYAKSFYLQYKNTDSLTAKPLVEAYEGGRVLIVQNPPALPLSELEMDDVYALPYQRDFHPSYKKEGGIPALSELKYSLTSSRGCFGGCNFCALTFHQGRRIQARSHDSIISEAEAFTKEKDFKGYINDVGGPTANFRHPSCEKQLTKGVCSNRQCLFPSPCKNLKTDHKDYLSLLGKLRKIPGVKKVFVRSGLRFDYLLYDKDREFLKELCEHHISGQLRVAPEHVSDTVLEKMGKPGREIYDRFQEEYKKVNLRLGKEQYAVPYLMSSHPGSGLKDAVMLAEYLNSLPYMPEQVQDFYPTPGTISTCMYYTELDPRTMKPVYVPKDPHEKAMQRALIQFRDPKQYRLVYEALIKAGRQDLIGYGKKCLIPPRQKGTEAKNDRKKDEKKKSAGGRRKKS